MSAALSFKEEALVAISRLPAKASANKVRETVDILAALRDAERASAEGQVVSHEEVERRLRSWHTN
jgi:predicted transcriptional regulator